MMSFETMTEQVLFSLFQLVLLAFIIERGLFLLFDYRHFRERYSERGVKAPIAFLVSSFICYYYEFDILARTINPGAETVLGMIITGAVVAGGSAAAMTLFHDVLKFTRSAQAEIAENKKVLEK